MNRRLDAVQQEIAEAKAESLGLAGKSLEAALRALEEFDERGTADPDGSKRRALVLHAAERDLVVLALVREGKDKDGNAYTTTWFDMFRIADGKIVEHWDTATKP